MDNGRTVVLKALTGSHNYNLATPESDKDYKLFVLPTFEELYKGEMYSKASVTDTVDYSIHDIRKLPNLFFKANLAFLEVLYSNEIETPHITEQIMKILSLRDEIVKMNLPYLYNACGGMFLQKMKLLLKGTEGTQHLVDKFGMDTKQALHAYRPLNFIERFEATGFKDFKKAITYNDGEERDFMLEIKSGYFKQEPFENFVDFYHESKFKPLKEKYHSQSVNEDLKIHLDELVMNLVKTNMYGLLNG